MRTPVFSHELSSYWSRYCCDPFKHHRRHIYSHLRVVPASLIAEHPSLSLHSGVVACCNCLKAIRECSPESRAPDVPLLECAGPSNEHAGSSNEHAGSSNERAGPSNERAGPSNERAGPSNERAGPSNKRAGPGNERVGSSSDPRASPSAWDGTGRCTWVTRTNMFVTRICTCKTQGIYEAMCVNYILVTHQSSTYNTPVQYIQHTSPVHTTHQSSTYNTPVQYIQHTSPVHTTHQSSTYNTPVQFNTPVQYNTPNQYIHHTTSPVFTACTYITRMGVCTPIAIV